MDASSPEEGADTETLRKIEVTVEAYLSLIDGRREYTKGSTLCLDVDWSEYSLIDLLSDIKSKYKWASYQQVEFWYLSKDNIYAKLCSDAELLSLLQGSRIVQFEMKIVGEQPNNDSQLVVQTETGPCDTELNVDCLASVGDDDGQADPEFELLDKPLFGLTVAGTQRVEEEEKEHYMIEGVDPDGDEPAGADEEWRYFKKGKKKAPENVTEQVQEDVPEQVQVEPVILPENFQDHDTDSVPDDETSETHG
ncbi:hypothetical protein EJB05_10633 [Eragrostis curvula]|uniref:Uncharacterized protein n=1 Tax=Eragrostis curvula TaxID=38414 RepID=A0A5J9VPD4_9POAL|nr:hypothetical protein EJB05_10633 [Eragrostis curvula]